MNLSPKTFDLIVIGAGPAGLTGATEAQQLGKNVLVLEAESQVGGISKTVARDGYLMC
jgi:phytoene dehydrogenase-like protein